MIYQVHMADGQYIQHCATTLCGAVVTLVLQHTAAVVIQLV